MDVNLHDFEFGHGHQKHKQQKKQINWTSKLKKFVFQQTLSKKLKTIHSMGENICKSYIQQQTYVYIYIEYITNNKREVTTLKW